MGGGSFDLTFYPGSQSADWSLKLWDALDDRRKRMLFWNTPAEQKIGEFCRELALSDVFAVATRNAAVLAYAWVSAAAPGSRVGTAHFAFTGEVIDQASEEFLDGIKQLKIYDCLLVVQPLAYKWAREHAVKHGFKVLGNVPGLIYYADKDRFATGVLLVKDLR